LGNVAPFDSVAVWTSTTQRPASTTLGNSNSRRPSS
jgi:hypothetical protein